MNREEKEKLEELVNALRAKLTIEEFKSVISMLLKMPKNEMEQLAELSYLIEEETTNH